jgi:hypothetical protein
LHIRVPFVANVIELQACQNFESQPYLDVLFDKALLMSQDLGAARDTATWAVPRETSASRISMQSMQPRQRYWSADKPK